MVPVSLRLQNFMSYGTAAPVLDFELFQVVCLSGRNGQGKSALLDAITWALWGEARKSSGSHKPDDELIRIGQRTMQVEFVFDIEGERYRVVRTYTRSASGKTTRPDLELHVYEPGADDYRPLTGASIRETQAQIDGVVGLDYNTFINSAFLLQGRSDEFTKKRPSERKDILARILNLSRYEQLFGLASERLREARREAEQAEHDLERLGAALEPEGEWKEEHARVEAEIQTGRERLEALRTEERCLTERLAGLDAREREAEALRRRLDALRTHHAEHLRDAEDLRRRIAEAGALIERREAIQRDHQRLLTLQQERDALDQKNELFRGIEKQIERVEHERRDRKAALERQLDRLNVEARSLREQLDRMALDLAEKPSLERRLERARAAAAEEERLGAVARQRQEIEQEAAVVERELVRMREALAGQLHALDAQIAREEAAQADLQALERTEATLEKEAAERDRLGEVMESISREGQALGEELQRLAAHRQSAQEKGAAIDEQLALLDQPDAGACPTCGTELTEAHRREVSTRLRDERRSHREAVQAFEARLDQHKQRQADLRERFKETRARHAALEGAPARLATLREQIRVERERREALAVRREEAAQLRRRLDADDYGPELRARRDALRTRLEGLGFDAEAFERVRKEAAGLAGLEAQFKRLEGLGGEQQQKQETLLHREREAEALREQLADGSALAASQASLERLRGQLAEVGFDPQRFREVKQEIEALSGAGQRMNDLVNAQQNQTEWRERLDAVEARAAQREAEIETQQQALAAVEGTLGARSEVEAEQRAKRAACAEAEAALNAVRVRLGELNQRLEQARRDREALRRRRRERRAAEDRAQLYRRLREAFSKHGIPSLIIEQTLPEIEERTNELLERLTEGRMNVRLETLKDKKTGGTKETLDITITDEQGVSRPYETFSGGEAFRVNFALRIALAQLLAERSGVRVRTLVIDEGFGTQDEQGVQNLVEAIQIIQDDFDKIVVITHLPELKEVFPVRIEVEKDPVDGSAFEIMGV